MNWGSGTSWTTDIDKPAEREDIDNCIRSAIMHKQQGNYEYDLFIQVTIPGEFEKRARCNIHCTAAVESTLCSANWLQKINETSDLVITVSRHATDVLKNTTYQMRNDKTGETGVLACHKPVETIGYPVKHHHEPTDLQLDLKYDFNYLVVAQWSARKFLEDTIKWFIEEHQHDEVGLVIKTSIAGGSQIDKFYTQKRLKSLLDGLPKDRQASIYLLHGDMTDRELHSLYVHPKIKGMISLGNESFGLPAFEACYSGLPLITCLYGGVLEYVYAPVVKEGKTKMRPHCLRVDYKIDKVQPHAVWKSVIEADSSWAFPDGNSFKEQMRELEKNYSLHKSRAKTLQKHLQETFTEEKIYAQYVDTILKAVQQKTVPQTNDKPGIMVI